MKKYYFIERKGEKKGPFTLEELRKEMIYEEDLIWNNEIENWTKSKNIEEISDLIITNPPKTPDEIIEQNIVRDNTLIKRIVINRTIKYYLIISFLITLIGYNNTQNFISDSLYRLRGQQMYYFSDSIFTRTIKSTFGNCTIEGGEYDNELLLFFNLLISSLLFFSVFFIPFGYIYYSMNKSTKSHYSK